MNKMRLANLSLGGIFKYAEGGGKDTYVANTYWMKVAEVFDPYGHYVGCTCVNVLMEQGIVLDDEVLPPDLVVVLN